MIQFIHSENSEEGTHELAQAILESLEAGKKTLWLMPGGSNVPISAEVMQELRAKISPDALVYLTISQTDERYGPVGHKDSNWKQLMDLGFDATGVTTIPVLDNLSLEETVARWGEKIAPVLDASDMIIGQFGIGPDGHIAGMLPHTSAVADMHATSGYVTETFTRLTLTPTSLRKIHTAYVFAFGESKKLPLTHLHDGVAPLAEEPLQILRDIPEVHVYSDQI